MKDELGGKVMTNLLYSKICYNTYSCLIDDCREDKRAKDTKKVCHKKKT